MKRIIFITSIRWGKACLEKTIENKNCEVVAIFTTSTPEKSAGFEPLDGLANRNGIPLYKIKNINNEVERMRKLEPDWIFTLGWSQILAEKLLRIPKDGAIGGHPTMLPKNKGRAPLTWAIIKGLDKTGFTFFHLAEKVDEGDIIAQEEIPIGPHDTVADLLNKVTKTSANLLGRILTDLLSGKATRIKQDPKKATYWPKRTPEDGIIDWNKTTKELYAWIRALTRPYPGAFTFYRGEKIIIWRACPSDMKGNPGEIIESKSGHIVVGTEDGGLRIEEMEPNIDVNLHDYFTK